MNAATFVVTAILAIIILTSAYLSYRTLKTGECAGCPNRGKCQKCKCGKVNCVFDENKE